MEVNRNCIFLLFLSSFLLFTLFGATQSHARSLQSPHATNGSLTSFLEELMEASREDSGKEINLATNFTQIIGNLETDFTQVENPSHEGNNEDGSLLRHALLESVSKKDKKKKMKKKKKKKKKKSAATTSRGTPSLALLFSTSMLGLVAFLTC